MATLAADSRSMHKSQGFGVARARGPIVEYFKVLDEAATMAGRRSPSRHAVRGPRAHVGSLPSKAAGLLRGLTDKAARAFDATKPYASIPALLALDRALDAAPDASTRAQKKREVADLVLACAGLFVEATAAAAEVAPGHELEITASAIDRAPVKVTLDELRFPFESAGVSVGKPVAAPRPTPAGAALEIKRTIRVPVTEPATTPYWLEAPPEPGLYRVADARLIGAPENEPALRVAFGLTIAGRTFTVVRAVRYKWTDPVMGERHRPVTVTPLVSVRPDASVLMFPDAGPRALVRAPGRRRARRRGRRPPRAARGLGRRAAHGVVLAAAPGRRGPR